MSRIGFFGGCFNPPTISHFEIAEKAIKEFNLDELIIIPMGDKFEKDNLAPFCHRYKMLKILFAEDHRIKISNIQEDQTKRFYITDTFKIIDDNFKNDDKFFIMGSDNFSNFAEWKDNKNLLENRNYIVVKRDNILPKKQFSNVKYLEIDKNTSSTCVREKIKQGTELGNEITMPIINYISKTGLYK